MSTKRGSAEGNGEDVVAKRGKVSLADSVDVNAVMSSEGPIVSAVILRANGECEELVMDMSPKLQLVAKELGCNVGFLGQWETLEVVLVTRTDQDNESIPLNTHTLQPPFHDAEVRGDILLMKNNEEGIPVDFTLKEYQEFQQLVIEKWEPGEALSDEGKSKLVRCGLVIISALNFPKFVSTNQKGTTRTTMKMMWTKMKMRMQMSKRTMEKRMIWMKNLSCKLFYNSVLLFFN